MKYNLIFEQPLAALFFSAKIPHIKYAIKFGFQERSKNMLKKYAKPYPTIGEIIAAKDFDYVSYRGYDEERNLPPATGNNT